MDSSDPIEKYADIVERIVAASLCWYVSAIGGPPTPVVVPVKPDAMPASISDRSLGRKRLAVSDTTTGEQHRGRHEHRQERVRQRRRDVRADRDAGQASDESDAHAAPLDVGVGRPRRR